MADYFSPTVVRPSIPAAAISRLELALLCAMFEYEHDGDAIYFYSSDGPAANVWIDKAELADMLADEAMPSSRIAEMIRARLAEAGPEETELELDLSDVGEAEILQGAVRRCAQLESVTIISAWTCTKMRPDGFGGGVTVITPSHILSSSTAQMECDLLDRVEHGALGCAPGHGSHQVLMLAEAEVRATVAHIQQAHTGTDIGGLEITDAQIRAGCLATIDALDRDEDLRSIEHAAAVAAIRIARSAI